ncbi:hypothetical protein BDW22DRAFT_1424441 [Trametopsis cervina]|nr:hypothetical protein BDW22DRAFT_1424441 [Trametopsis cervina]
MLKLKISPKIDISSTTARENVEPPAATEHILSPSTQRSQAAVGINRLPHEILSQIFVMWAHDDEDGPWMAAAVCGYWRKVVLATSQAWGRITLRLEPAKEMDPEWCIEEEDLEMAASPRNKRRPLGLWLERADGAELSLHLTINPLCPGLEEEIWSIMNGIKERTQCLRRITLLVESVFLTETILEIISVQMPECRLQHLEIVLSEKRVPVELRDLHSEGRLITRFWDFAPPAETLVFRGCVPPSGQSSSASHVHTLVVEDVERAVPLHMFPNIRHLEMKSVQIIRLSSPDPPPFQFLETLSIHSMSTVHCALWMTKLKAPNLTHLSIGNYGKQELHDLWSKDPESKWADIMHEFGSAFTCFVRNSPSVGSLHLRRSPIDDIHFLEILEELPGLHELSIDTLLIGTPAMRGLTPGPPGKSKGRRVLCPRLQHLHIENCASIQKTSLLRLLEARYKERNRCAPIERLTIADCEGLEGIDTEVLSLVDPAAVTVKILREEEP